MDAEQRAAAREEPGDLAAQVHRLQAALRQGRVTSPQLALLAWTGHAASGAALGSRAPDASGEPPLHDRTSALTLALAAAEVALAGTPAGEAALAVGALRNWLQGRIGLPELTEVGQSLTHTEQSRYELLNRERSEALRARFRLEVARPNPHPVRDLLPVAAAWATDDVAGIVLEGDGAPFGICDVHLTWASRTPEEPGFPGHWRFPQVSAWLAGAWLRHADRPGVAVGDRPAREAFQAAVIPLALCPATLDAAPWFNGCAAFAALALSLGESRARAEVAQRIQDRALLGDP